MLDSAVVYVLFYQVWLKQANKNEEKFANLQSIGIVKNEETRVVTYSCNLIPFSFISEWIRD